MFGTYLSYSYNEQYDDEQVRMTVEKITILDPDDPHCCPTSVQDELGGGFYQANALTDFLDEVAQQRGFKYLFFGHYHDNKIVQKSMSCCISRYSD